MKAWFNPRSLIPGDDLAEIYKYERISDNSGLFPARVLEHWAAVDPWIEIPDALRDLLAGVGRATPLTRARRLEQLLGTRSRIYLKREDLLPNGSFKITSALPQVYFGKEEGRKRVVVETGAGQTGAASALASRLLGLTCDVYMVAASYERKLLRRRLMELYGASVRSSPSTDTEVGRSHLAAGRHEGSIAMATSEIMEIIARDPSSMNVAGSLLDFTLTYNSVLGLETVEQLDALGEAAGLVIASVGGGSSFGGFALPFLEADRRPVEIIAAESTAVPTLTAGTYDYDHPDGEGQAAPLKMYSLGHKFIPSAMHATGLRYHAASPVVSYLVSKGVIRAEAFDERRAIEAARVLAETEGIVVAPESSYSIRALLDRLAANPGREDTIVVLISGSGQLDLDAYFPDSE